MSWMDGSGGGWLEAAASFFGGERRNKAQSEAADKQMDFQQTTSSNAYQRAMEDMRDAGLNPILAGKLGGASSPGGAMPLLADTLTPAMQTGQDATRTKSDKLLKEANAALTNAQAVLTKNLQPGSEAINTLTQHAADLLKAADNMIKKYNPSYDTALEAITDTISDLMHKSKDKKGFLNQLGKTLINSHKLSPERVKKLLERLASPKATTAKETFNNSQKEK